MNESEKNDIVKKILEELKSKKLLNTPKSSFKSTEKVLFSYNVLPEALKLMDEEIQKLREESSLIVKPTAKSNTLILNEKEGTYVYGDETLETRISELRQIAAKTRSQIRIIKSALKKVECDNYYNIIPLYYFDKKTIEKVAEEMDCSVGAISKHKKRLINELKVYIFPDTFMKEL